MKNEIAQLVEAYNDFWNDVNSLSKDIVYIVSTKYKWTQYEYSKIEKGCFYNSFYHLNELLYILIDLNEDIPYLQISLFHLSDANDEDDDEVGTNYLDSNWKGADPRSYLWDKNYDVQKTNNGFSVIIEEREKYVFSAKIDLMSIKSSNIVDDDVNELIGSIISGSYETYSPKKLKYVETEI